MCQDKETVWLFGYGSLIWRPGFEYLRKFACFIQNYERVFWQLDTVYRGTTEKPGRVASLIEKKGAITFGMCYQITIDRAVKIFESLDKRESMYIRKQVQTFSKDVPAVMAELYITNPQHSSLQKPKNDEELAFQIASAVGNAGPNYDYLFNLSKSMRLLNILDEPLFALEENVRRILEKMREKPKDVKAKICECKVEVGVIVDDGAVRAISNQQKNLLPVGIRDIQGEFGKNQIIGIWSTSGELISKGIVNFSSHEIQKIMGLHSSKICSILGKEEIQIEVVHSTMMILR